jgi:PAS domain S-box-containing protein
MATILIVDDLTGNRQFLVELLSRKGHLLLEAANGREGLAAAQAGHPDLVITDVLMPVMDGYELVRQLRLDPGTSRIPVLFYTAPYGEREARALARSSGVPYVLRKPADPDEVLAIVSRLLAGQPELDTPPDTDQYAMETDREHLRLLADTLSDQAEDLRAANARLRAVVNIGLELASKPDTDHLLESVCTAVCDLFGATYVTVGIVDPHGETVQRCVSCGAGPTWGVGAAGWIKAGDKVPGFFRLILAEQRTRRGDNPGGDAANLQLPVLHPEIQAFLATPITSPTHVYGWICLVGNEGRTFTDQDEQLVVALSGQVGRLYEVEREISRRKETESALRREREALRTAEERMRFALQSANVGIWDMDYAAGVYRWSETLEAHYGLRPGMFRGTFDAFIECIHPDDREAVLETFAKATKSGAEFSLENRAVWPDGSVRWLIGGARVYLGPNGEPVRAVGISVDVTGRRALEAQYQHAQKMEAIGQLVGSVAHDFNNLLTAILGYSELLLESLPAGDKRRADAEEIQKAGTSAARLTRQLLAFSRREASELTRIDLNVVVRDMRAMLRRLVTENVNIVLTLQPALVSVIADRGQLEQVVMNLVVNAGDAMPTGGTLTIETANVDVSPQHANALPSAVPGPYALLAVTDTGTGMTPEAQARLFEPFFTTKSPGKGTGLGLATVQGIIVHLDGYVEVDSQVGRGTSVKAYIPKARAADAVVVPPAPADRPHGGGQTVLVVDDSRGLRELVKRQLEQLGYAARVAADATEAARLFDRDASIQVLLTDVVMLGASGPELAAQLAHRRPTLRVIYMSGYTADAIAQHGVPNHGIGFLHKPFTSEELGQTIREALDASTQSARADSASGAIGLAPR